MNDEQAERRRKAQNEASRRWRLRNPEKRKDGQKRYFEANKDALLAYSAQHYQDNKAKYTTYHSAYRAANKEKIKAKRQAKRGKL